MSDQGAQSKAHNARSVAIVDVVNPAIAHALRGRGRDPETTIYVAHQLAQLLKLDLILSGFGQATWSAEAYREAVSPVREELLTSMEDVLRNGVEAISRAEADKLHAYATGLAERAAKMAAVRFGPCPCPFCIAEKEDTGR